jgi:uncharacterized protein involved in exopolysaccharide biosynthesis
MDELSLSDYLAILIRRRKIFFLTFGLVFVVAVVGTLRWSNYRSIAVVEIEESKISANMTTPAGMTPSDMLEALADQRVSRIQQKVTSSPSLIEIINKLKLYPGRVQSTPLADVADGMRKKIKVGLVSSAINQAAAGKESAQQLAAIAFTLSFDYSDPTMAQKTADELVNRFLDEDLKERRVQSKETTAFLEAQIAALEFSMVDQEKKIAAFHEEHGNSRPEALMFNQQAAQSILLSIQNLDSQIMANEGSQGALRAQLAVVDPYSRVVANGQVLTTPAIQLKALEAQYSTLTAQYGSQHPDVVKAKRQIESLRAQTGLRSPSGEEVGRLKAQIIDMRTNLDTALKTKGAENPDVISMRHQLDELEENLANAKKGRSPSLLKQDADNPAYLQLVAQFHSSEEQHKALLEQRVQLQKQYDKYQQALAETPASEKDLASLTRDYENIQLRYRDMKEKKMAAEMEEKMIDDRVSQRLVVIDPPKMPIRTQPPRGLLLFGGLLLALACGIGGVTVSEALGHSIHGARHLNSLVGAAPLVTIPYILTPDEKKRVQLWRHRGIHTGLLVVLVVVIIATRSLAPVNAVWDFITLHLGLS